VVYIGILIKNRKLFEDELIAAKKFAEKTLQENTLLTRLKEELHNNLEQLDQQLNVVKKQNEELRQFNRVITHDLTEPLRKLTIFSNMLLESITDKAVQRKTIERVLHISGKMRLLVSGLQQYIWITETPVFNTPIDLKNLLLLVKQQLKETFKDVEIVIDLQSSQSIEGDWDQLKLLFYNLLENAVLFRKDTFKAEIFISVFNVRLNKFTSVSGKYKYVDFIRMDIKDNGIGFDPQYKEQVFELFKKLHTEDRRGIGLSLCKKIVQNHNGTISVNSKQGIGTTVTILLPYIPVREPANNYN
jgi:phosphoserine phosphatase RsbU/P